MLPPSGNNDVPTGHLAAVVTYLEMRAPADAPPPLASDLCVQRVETPKICWYRMLFRAVGEEWLWSSRLRMRDSELLTILRAPSKFSPCAATKRTAGCSNSIFEKRAPAKLCSSA